MLPILIVDDEPHIARLIEMTLEPLGQPLVLACDGEQAADLLEKQQFDLVLLDVMRMTTSSSRLPRRSCWPGSRDFCATPGGGRRRCGCSMPR